MHTLWTHRNLTRLFFYLKSFYIPRQLECLFKPKSPGIGKREANPFHALSLSYPINCNNAAFYFICLAQLKLYLKKRSPFTVIMPCNEHLPNVSVLQWQTFTFPVNRSLDWFRWFCCRSLRFPPGVLLSGRSGCLWSLSSWSMRKQQRQVK